MTMVDKIKTINKITINCKNKEKLLNKKIELLKDTEKNSDIKANKLVKTKIDDIYYSEAPYIESKPIVIPEPIKNSDVNLELIEQEHKVLDLVRCEKEITNVFIDITKILASNGLKGARAFNKSHEIIQILEFKHMIDLAIKLGILSKNTTVHIGTLSYKNAPDIIIHTVENNMEKFITVQLKSLNTLISKKNINNLSRRYKDTDMIIININELYIAKQLALSEKFLLDNLNKIYYTTINKETMLVNHQWIINVLIYHLAKENIENIKLMNQYYIENIKISEKKPYDLWVPLSEEDINRSIEEPLELASICVKDLIDLSTITENDTNDNKSNELLVTKDQETIIILVAQKSRAAGEIKSNFVSVDNPDSKFGSYWYTSIRRAEQYKADNIPLTAGNIMLGIATGYDKFS